MGRSGQIDLDRNVAVRRNDAADHAGAMALQSITKLDQRPIELGDQTRLPLATLDEALLAAMTQAGVAIAVLQA